MATWEEFRIIRYDDRFLDGKLDNKALEFMNKRKLFGINEFFIFMLPSSVRIVGEKDSFENPTINMRTKDVGKVMKRLEGFVGDLLFDTVKHKGEAKSLFQISNQMDFEDDKSIGKKFKG